MQRDAGNGAEVARQLNAFVVENFLFGCTATRLHGDDSFLDKGLIDSTGVLELVAYIERRFQITVDDAELVPENLDSIDRLVNFIGRKQRQSVCAEP